MCKNNRIFYWLKNCLSVSILSYTTPWIGISMGEAPWIAGHGLKPSAPMRKGATVPNAFSRLTFYWWRRRSLWLTVRTSSALFLTFLVKPSVDLSGTSLSILNFSLKFIHCLTHIHTYTCAHVTATTVYLHCLHGSFSLSRIHTTIH